MKKVSNCLRDSGITVFLLLLAFAVSLLCQKLDVEEHTTTVFVFAVFLISLVMAVIVAILATKLVNYLFSE